MSAGVATRAIDRRDQAVVLLAGLSWVAALVHAVVVPEHWSEYKPYAVAFALLAVLQAAFAVAVFRAPGRRLLIGGAVLSLGVVAVWALSRTTGLPLGPEAGEPEAAGPLDVAASMAELAIAGAGVAWGRSWPEVTVPAWALRAGTALLVAVGAALLFGGHAH